MANRVNSQTKLYKQCEAFVSNAYRSLEEDPQKLRTFINLFHRAKKSDSKLLESQMKLVNLIQDFPDLVRQLNQLVPDEFKVLELDLGGAYQGTDEQIDINTIFTELHKRRPDKVKELINLLQSFKNKQNGNANIQNLRETVCKILEDEPGLLNAFMKCVEPMINEAGGDIEEELEQTNKVLRKIDKASNIDQKLKPKQQKANVMDKVPAYRPQSQRDTKRREVDNNLQVVPVPSEWAWSSFNRNEMYLFEYLEKNMSEEAYNELAKIIYLYTECIISPIEVFKMTKHLFEGNDNYFTFFQEIIHFREPIRRKNTSLFKPLNEVDFKKLNCERNKSYTKLPDNFTYAKNPLHPKNQLCGQVLNKTWVSVPQGSELNFKVNTRNAYEAALFTCEDERYEFDVGIYNYKMAVKWLQSLENLRADEERSQIVEKLLKLKVIQKVYGNNSEIIDLFKKNPANVAKFLIERVQTKLQELLDTKWNQAKKKWLEVASQNFHRSLDHRSFFFKQSEKKLTSHKNFISDAQTRHTELNMKDNFQKSLKYLNILDTFEGLSNGQSCKHPQTDNLEIAGLLQKNVHPRKVLPIYRMFFGDKKIAQDIADILNLRIQSFHTTSNEKEKIIRYFKIFMTEFMNLPHKAENTYETLPDQNAVSNIVTQIEAKIFTKIFHFKVGKIMNDGVKASPDDGLNSSLNKMNVEKDKEKDKSKKSEMETEQIEDSNGKSEGNLKTKKAEAESQEDDLRLDSSSEGQANIKEMDYDNRNDGSDIIFLPSSAPGEKIFYGTQHVYCLIRFYFTLYERFAKARELSQEFEANVKTAILSQNEKEALSEERYNVFKWVLIHLLRSNIDNEKYEDLLRSVFGNKAYLMFYIDKIVHSIILTIPKLVGDDITLRTLNIFAESELQTKNQDLNKTKSTTQKGKNWPEHVYLARLNQLTFKHMSNLQNTSFFRFLYSPKTHLITVSLYDYPYKDWKDKNFEGIIPYSKVYVSSSVKDNCFKASNNPIYLKRNKELNRKKSVANLIKIVTANNVESRYLPNTQRLITDKIEQEEYLFISKKKGAAADDAIKRVYSQLEKIRKFKIWYKKIAKV